MQTYCQTALNISIFVSRYIYEQYRVGGPQENASQLYKNQSLRPIVRQAFQTKRHSTHSLYECTCRWNHNLQNAFTKYKLFYILVFDFSNYAFTVILHFLFTQRVEIEVVLFFQTYPIYIELNLITNPFGFYFIFLFG